MGQLWNNIADMTIRGVMNSAKSTGSDMERGLVEISQKFGGIINMINSTNENLIATEKMKKFNTTNINALMTAVGQTKQYNMVDETSITKALIKDNNDAMKNARNNMTTANVNQSKAQADLQAAISIKAKIDGMVSAQQMGSHDGVSNAAFQINNANVQAARVNYQAQHSKLDTMQPRYQALIAKQEARINRLQNDLNKTYGQCLATQRNMSVAKSMMKKYEDAYKNNPTQANKDKMDKAMAIYSRNKTTYAGLSAKRTSQQSDVKKAEASLEKTKKAKDTLEIKTLSADTKFFIAANNFIGEKNDVTTKKILADLKTTQSKIASANKLIASCEAKYKAAPGKNSLKKLNNAKKQKASYLTQWDSLNNQLLTNAARVANIKVANAKSELAQATNNVSSATTNLAIASAVQKESVLARYNPLTENKKNAQMYANPTKWVNECSAQLVAADPALKNLHLENMDANAMHAEILKGTFSKAMSANPNITNKMLSDMVQVKSVQDTFVKPETKSDVETFKFNEARNNPMAWVSDCTKKLVAADANLAKLGLDKMSSAEIRQAIKSGAFNAAIAANPKLNIQMFNDLADGKEIQEHFDKRNSSRKGAIAKAKRLASQKLNNNDVYAGAMKVRQMYKTAETAYLAVEKVSSGVITARLKINECAVKKNIGNTKMQKKAKDNVKKLQAKKDKQNLKKEAREKNSWKGKRQEKRTEKKIKKVEKKLKNVKLSKKQQKQLNKLNKLKANNPKKYAKKMSKLQKKALKQNNMSHLAKIRRKIALKASGVVKGLGNSIKNSYTKFLTGKANIINGIKKRLMIIILPIVKFVGISLFIGLVCHLFGSASMGLAAIIDNAAPIAVNEINYIPDLPEDVDYEDDEEDAESDPKSRDKQFLKKMKDAINHMDKYFLKELELDDGTKIGLKEKRTTAPAKDSNGDIIFEVDKYWEDYTFDYIRKQMRATCGEGVSYDKIDAVACGIMSAIARTNSTNTLSPFHYEDINLSEDIDESIHYKTLSKPRRSIAIGFDGMYYYPTTFLDEFPSIVDMIDVAPYIKLYIFSKNGDDEFESSIYDFYNEYITLYVVNSRCGWEGYLTSTSSNVDIAKSTARDIYDLYHVTYSGGYPDSPNGNYFTDYYCPCSHSYGETWIKDTGDAAIKEEDGKEYQLWHLECNKCGYCPYDSSTSQWAPLGYDVNCIHDYENGPWVNDDGSSRTTEDGVTEYLYHKECNKCKWPSYDGENSKWVAEEPETVAEKTTESSTETTTESSIETPTETPTERPTERPNETTAESLT